MDIDKLIYDNISEKTEKDNIDIRSDIGKKLFKMKKDIKGLRDELF